MNYGYNKFENREIYITTFTVIVVKHYKNVLILFVRFYVLRCDENYFVQDKLVLFPCNINVLLI